MFKKYIYRLKRYINMSKLRMAGIQPVSEQLLFFVIKSSNGQMVPIAQPAMMDCQIRGY